MINHRNPNALLDHDLVAKGDEEIEKMDINAVLSLGVQGEEDSYVSLLAVLILTHNRLLTFR